MELVPYTPFHIQNMLQLVLYGTKYQPGHMINVYNTSRKLVFTDKCCHCGQKLPTTTRVILEL
jgi:hypothetical protein